MLKKKKKKKKKKKNERFNENSRCHWASSNKLWQTASQRLFVMTAQKTAIGEIAPGVDNWYVDKTCTDQLQGCASCSLQLCLAETWRCTGAALLPWPAAHARVHAAVDVEQIQLCPGIPGAERRSWLLHVRKDVSQPPSPCYLSWSGPCTLLFSGLVSAVFSPKFNSKSAWDLNPLPLAVR